MLVIVAPIIILPTHDNHVTWQTSPDNYVTW